MCFEFYEDCCVPSPEMSLRGWGTPDLDITVLQIFSSRMLQDILKDVVKGCVLFGFLLLLLFLFKALPIPTNYCKLAELK